MKKVRIGVLGAYRKNYCYMPAPYEMKKLYESGEIGEFEYCEGEYIHNCEPIWPSITYGEPDHWRNGGYATFYCTPRIAAIQPTDKPKFEPLEFSPTRSSLLYHTMIHCSERSLLCHSTPFEPLPPRGELPSPSLPNGMKP